LNVLPSAYASQDGNRVTLMYFVVSAMDILGMSEELNKKQIIDNIYNLQVLPDQESPEKNAQNCGFRGGNYFGNKYNPNCEPAFGNPHDQSHIAMTYTALAILKICGDDFSKVNRQAIVTALHKLQQENGSFSPVSGGSENDMRFIYCACVISHLIGDWSGINKQKVVQYILSSQSYDYGIAQGPGQESHGGSTYCAVASLSLMDKLNELPHKEELIRWCLERQVTGFQGRINKIPDTCYSFWIGASLTMLGAYDLVDFNSIIGHTMSCEAPTGGFSKWPNTYPDVMHTYLAICGLSLGGFSGIKSINCMLGFSVQ